MASSISGELKTRVKRFGKTTTNVPGTYMSAAGVQSEIHPTTLARLAVHEAQYRKQVHVYQQEMQNTVYSIRKDQKSHRRSLHEYRKRKRYNRKNPIVFRSLDHFPKIENILSGSTAKSMKYDQAVENEEVVHLTSDKPTDKKTLENNSDSSINILMNVNKSDTPTIDVTDFNAINTEHNTNAEGRPIHDNDQRTMNATSKSFDLLPLKDNETETAETDNIDCLKGSIANSNDLSPKGKDMADGIKSKRSDVVLIDGNTQSEFQIDDEVKYEKSKTDIFNFEFSKPRKKQFSTKSSDTASFMKLIRMKNHTGLTKNLRVIDSIINDSKTKKFMYLNTSQKQPADGKFGSSLVSKNEIAVNHSESNTKNSSYLPNLTKSKEGTVIQSQKSTTLGSHLDGLNAPQAPNVNVTGKKAKPNVQRSSISPDKTMDKYLYEEKLKSKNYKDDITWQETLSSIKSVHQISNKPGNFEQFAFKVLQQ